MGMSVQLVEERIQAGWHLCAACGALSLPERTKCFHCSADFPGARAQVPTRGPAPRQRRSASNKQAPRGQHSYGSLVDPVDLTVIGLPESQGSGTAVAPGVYKHVKGPELRRWRQAITRVAQETLGPTWVAPNAPTGLIAVFTVPAPSGAGATSEADGYRDLDKLLRAVNDGLCPASGFRAVASDMRHTLTVTAKTYPAGVGTHPMALPQPGVWLRLYRPTTVIVDGAWTITIPLPTDVREGASR